MADLKDSCCWMPHLDAEKILGDCVWSPRMDKEEDYEERAEGTVNNLVYRSDCILANKL